MSEEILTDFTTTAPTLAPAQLVLTEEQQKSVDLITAWMNSATSPKEFKLGGYAGTGKTTVIKTIIATLRTKFRCRVAAFTGKAVSVLAKKEIYGDTIHSLIYNAELIKGVGYKFYLKDKLDPNCDLIIIDEASMISSELYRDLKTFGKKILFVGDPGQLEPVGDNPNLMKSPDFVLSKIHRQAEKSPILTLANSVRTGGTIPRNFVSEGLITRGKGLQVKDLLSVDQVICARNKTRRGFNEDVRKGLGRPLDQICVDDKIIILKNNREFNVFNGLIMFVTEVVRTLPDHFVVHTKDELDKKYYDLKLWKKTFQVEKLEKGEWAPKGMIEADFGWCITAHKSQGSEWNSVLLYDEWMPPQVWDMCKWRYTGITRAANKLIYCI